MGHGAVRLSAHFDERNRMLAFDCWLNFLIFRRMFGDMLRNDIFAISRKTQILIRKPLEVVPFILPFA